MKGRHKIGIWLCVVFAFLLGGCSTFSNVNENTFLLYNNQEVTTGEGYTVFLSLQAMYNEMYGTQYGSDFWEGEFFSDAEISFRTYVKEYVYYEEWMKLLALNELAEEEKITIAGDQNEELQAMAQTFYEGISARDRSRYDIQVEDVYQVMLWYSLAQAYIEALAKEVDLEVSDEEARVYEVYVYQNSTRENAEYFMKSLEEGAGFFETAATLSSNSTVIYYISQNSTELPAEVISKGMALSENDTTDILEADGYYYVVKMVNDYQAEMTEANREKIKEERIYSTWMKDYQENSESAQIRINRKFWNSLSFGYSDFKEVITGLATSE